MEYEIKSEKNSIKIKWTNGKENHYEGLRTHEIKECDNKSLIIKNRMELHHIENGNAIKILNLIDNENYDIKYSKSHKKLVIILINKNDYVYGPPSAAR